MRKLWLVLGILVFIDSAYFSYVNRGTEYVLNYKPIIEPFTLDSGIAIISMALYGALGAFLICHYYMCGLNDKIKKQSRNVEKASIESEESTDKVKALEAKIETLEASLKDALNSNQG